MTTEELYKRLNFYCYYLNHALECITINDRMCDWYDLYKKDFFEISNLLGIISQSLMTDFYITSSKLYGVQDSNTLNIRKLHDTIVSNKINSTKIHEKMKFLVKKINDDLNENKEVINNLKKWRDKYFAHFDKGIITNHLNILNNIDNKKLKDMINNHINIINELIKLCGKKIIIPFSKIDDGVDNLCFEYLYSEKFINPEIKLSNGKIKFPE